MSANRRPSRNRQGRQAGAWHEKAALGGRKAVNEALGRALRETRMQFGGIAEIVQVEKTGVLAGAPRRKPDILIMDNWAPPIVVETSFIAADADKDAASRLGKKTARGGHPISIAASVHLANAWRAHDLAEITERLVGGAPLNYALFQQPKANPDSRRRWPISWFLDRSVYDFARFLSASCPRKT